MKKFLLLLTTLCLTFTIISTPVLTYATTKSSDSDDLVAIVDGIRITKNDIDENNIIKDGVIPETKESFFRYSTPPTMNIPKGTSNSLVIKTQSAPRFSQQVDYYYLNSSNAPTFAYKLTGSGTSTSQLVNWAIGALIGFKVSNPWVGVLYSGVTMMGGIRLNAVRNKILSHEKKPVEVRVIKNNNGTFYAVNAWNGRTIDIGQGGNTKLKFVKHN